MNNHDSRGVIGLRAAHAAARIINRSMPSTQELADSLAAVGRALNRDRKASMQLDEYLARAMVLGVSEERAHEILAEEAKATESDPRARTDLAIHAAGRRLTQVALGEEVER